MCIVCILFLLAVRRLVLIVNSWDVLGGTETGGRLSPYYWNSVLLRPDESFRICFFSFICIFPELEELKGDCFCKVEGQEELRTMTKRKITFPLEEKNKKKINGCSCVFIYPLMFFVFFNVLQVCLTCGLQEQKSLVANLNGAFLTDTVILNTRVHIKMWADTTERE